MEFIKNLKCPITNNNLDLIKKEEFPGNYENFSTLTNGLADKTRQYFYPVFDNIIILHEQYALFIGEGQDKRGRLSFDKQRVFDYYNEISYKTRDSLKIFEDSPRWVDFREVSATYIRTSLKRASQFYPSAGTYFLDIASGSVGLPEYMALSDGYEYRICIDISINALIQAKINIEKAGKQGIFICGDITNIPLQDNSVDTVLSQHTLYHVPKSDQKTAVNELYRVARPGSRLVIIYSWFYHSWFMNLSLNFIQLYRIFRHFAGKIYARFSPSKPRLYFYPHSRRWFKKSFEFSEGIEFYSWRSVNKYFLDIFIHKGFFGKQILNRLINIENKYSKFMGRFGEYCAIVITKKK